MINMDLESTIVTINNLLKLDFESSFSDFIQPQKQLMAIPDYQREYKWEKSKIKTFVDNTHYLPGYLAWREIGRTYFPPSYT